MKLNLREFFKLTVIYTIVAAITPIIQVIILPFFEGEGRLNAIDFSNLAITESISVLVFIITLYSMGNALNRFYYDYTDDKEGYNKLVSGVFTSILLRGMVLLGAAFIFGGFIGSMFPQKELQDFSSYGYAAIIVGIDRAINMAAATLYRNEKKVGSFILINVGAGLLRTLFQVIWLFNVDMSFRGYIYGSCIGSIIMSVGVLTYIYYKCGFKYSTSFMKPLNQFGRPLFQYGLISWGVMFADRYFLKLFNLQEELGIYDIAMKFGFGINMVMQGLQAASQPEVFRFMKEGINKTQEETRKVCNLLMAQTQGIIVVALIPTMLYISYLFETKLQLAAGLISIIFITYIFRTQQVILSFPIYFMKKTSIFLYLNTFVLVVNLGLNYLLIPVFKVYGAIISVLVSQFIMIIALYFYQKKIADIKWNLNKIMIYPFAIVIITIVLEIIKNIFNLNPFITTAAVMLSIITGLIMLYKKEIREVFIKRLFSF